jgi:hypothetical protein
MMGFFISIFILVIQYSFLLFTPNSASKQADLHSAQDNTFSIFLPKIEKLYPYIA